MAADDVGPADGTSTGGIGEPALAADLERRIAGLPESLPEILSEDEYRRPEIVEALMARAESMRAAHDPRCEPAADLTRVLAAELPADLPIDRRLQLRARSLELWATMLRLAGRLTRAEAALLCAFELLSRAEEGEPADLAAILGRLALIAADAGRPDDLARYAHQAVAITHAADLEWPLPAFVHLWTTVMTDPKSLKSARRVARALFWAVSAAYRDFEKVPWAMALEIEQGEGETEIRLDRRVEKPGRSGELLDDPIVCIVRERTESE